MSEYTPEIWFDLRLLTRACNPEDELLADDLKAYICLAAHLAYKEKVKNSDHIFSKQLPRNIAEDIFADKDFPNDAEFRIDDSVRRLVADGLIEIVDDNDYRLMTVGGLPYRTNRTTGYKGYKGDLSALRGTAFQYVKSSLYKDYKGLTTAPIKTLSSEEFLLMLLLFQGSRWAWGGCHQEYVRKQDKRVQFGELVTVLWEDAISKIPKGYITASDDMEVVLWHLIEKGFFCWAKTLMSTPMNRSGMKVSTQQTVILSMDARVNQKAQKDKNAPKMTDVLVPCLGYAAASNRTMISKMLENGVLEYEGMTPEDCIRKRHFFGIMKRSPR